MKVLNVLKRLSRLWVRNGKEEKMPFSIILLLRKPHVFTESELRAAGERGFGKRFDGKADPMYFVVQKGAFTMVKAGPNVMNLVHANQPYLGDAEAVAKQLPHEEQQRAWLEHTAWAALDFWNLKQPKADAYAVLARLALQLGDQNCSGVFLPADNLMMPNDGTAEEGLRLLMKKELLS